VLYANRHEVLKTLFIVPTDAHYYKIIEMLKQLKIIILVPTRFSSRRNHHQGAVLCLAKTTEYVFFSVLVGIVEAVPDSTVNCTPAQPADMPP